MQESTQIGLDEDRTPTQHGICVENLEKEEEKNLERRGEIIKLRHEVIVVLEDGTKN